MSGRGPPRTASPFDGDAPAAPPGALAQGTAAPARWLLPLAPPLVLVQSVLLVHDAGWGPLAAEVAVAVVCLVVLAEVLRRHRQWRPALAVLPLTALLTWAGWILTHRDMSMSLLEVFVFLPSPLVGLGLMFVAMVRQEPRHLVAAAVAWFPVPPMLLVL